VLTAVLPKLESVTLQQPVIHDSDSDSDASDDPDVAGARAGSSSTADAYACQHNARGSGLVGGISMGVSCLTQLSHFCLCHLGGLDATGAVTGLQKVVAAAVVGAALIPAASYFSL
jgi:hypothetical protein